MCEITPAMLRRDLLLIREDIRKHGKRCPEWGEVLRKREAEIVELLEVPDADTTNR